MYIYSLLSILFVGVIGQALASSRCASAKGKIVCQKNPDVPLSAEIRMWDKDGKQAPGWMRWFTSAVDPDDPMGRAHPEADGSFEVHGCADDTFSDPDPYIVVFHYCNRDSGQFTTIATFRVFDDKGDVFMVNGGKPVVLDA